MDVSGELLKQFHTGIVSDVDPWDEEPAPLEVFLYDAGYLMLPELSPLQYQFLENLDDDNPQTNVYTEGVLQWGKGSGKDWISGVFLARRAYKLLCLKNPQRYYDLSDNVNIDLLNVAYNASQANAIFFTQFLATIKGKKCFERYGYEPKGSVVRFGKAITAYSGHSDKEGQEGYNLFAAVADEISAFKTSQELGLTIEDKGSSKASRARGAEGLISMLRSSIKSRFPKTGKLVMLSYPRYKGDYIQQAYAEGIHRRNTYVSFGATFDVNPTKKREDFNEEYENDPVEAAAKYECKPPHSRSNYYTPEMVKKFFDTEMNVPYNPVTNELAGWFHPYHLGIDDETPCWIHVDLSLRHDAAGFAMGYCSSYVFRKIADELCEAENGEDFFEDRVEEMKPVVKFPLITRWKAAPRGEIDFAVVRKLIITIRKRGFYIRGVSYDQYQSADSIQILKKLGFRCQQISADVSLGPHATLRELIKDGRAKTHCLGDREMFRIWCEDTEDPRLKGKIISDFEPIASELLGLELLNNAKVNHTDLTSKDMVDAAAVVARQIVEGAKRSIQATEFGSSSNEYDPTRGKI